jgi:hypothetical protein
MLATRPKPRGPHEEMLENNRRPLSEHQSKAGAESRELAATSAHATRHGRELPPQVADRVAYFSYARKQSEKWTIRHWALGAVILTTLSTGMVVGVRQAFHVEKKRLPESKRQNVVILGSGFAALSCAAEMDTGKYNVTVVSPRNHFLFTPVLPQVRSSSTPVFPALVFPLPLLCSPVYSPVFKFVLTRRCSRCRSAH